MTDPDTPQTPLDGHRQRPGENMVRRDYGSAAQSPAELVADGSELQFFDAGLALGYYRRLEAIVEACPVDIYAASSLKHPWPYRLQNAAECYPASFWRSPRRILDSAIVDPALTNAAVLEIAVEREATAVVAKDYLPFDGYDEADLDEQQQRALDGLRRGYDDHVAATTDSIREFAELHDPKRHPPAYIPLQPPYDEHVREVAPIVDGSHLQPRYTLGGLKDADADERLRHLRAFRSEVGPGPVAHGLGWGPSDRLVMALREEPSLLDSLDNSGPANAIQNDAVLDKHWRAADCAQVDGQYQNAIGGAFEFGMLLSASHRLTPFNDDYGDAFRQHNLGDFGGVGTDD